MQYCDDGFALGAAYCLIILRQVGDKTQYSDNQEIVKNVKKKYSRN